MATLAAHIEPCYFERRLDCIVLKSDYMLICILTMPRLSKKEEDPIIIAGL